MTSFDGVVIESVVETADTRTLVIDVGSVSTYRAGQYITIDPHQFAGLRSFVAYLEHLKGRREAPRAYSMSSAPHERHLAVTIKEELYEVGRSKYPPLLSGFLVHHLHPGERLSVRGFAGAYVLPDDVERRTEHILHVCAGSGGVPNLSMVKDSLRRHTRLRHTFLYSNRTWEDVIFRDVLARLEGQQPARLRVIHTLTRESDATVTARSARRGPIGRDLLREALDTEPGSLVYVCGPAVTVWERRARAAEGTAPAPRFLESVRGHLLDLGVPADRIKVESYG
jgi:ferredoxin-NADP reductase